MNAHQWAIALLLGFAVAITWICCIGLVAMRDPYQKLHYIAPPASLGVFAIFLALLLQKGWNQASIKALIIVGVLTLLNSVVSHATARAFRMRAHGDWRPRGEEIQEMD